MVDPRFSGDAARDPRFYPPLKSSGLPGSEPSTVQLLASVTDPTVARGMKFPFQFVDGRPLLCEGDAKIKSNLSVIMATLPGEYICEPTFGCDIGRRVFDPINTVVLGAHDIKRAVHRWEPRAEILGVSVDSSREVEGIAGFNVNYQIRGDSETSQLTVAVR